MTPLELVQATSLPFNDAGAAAYFHPVTSARGKELGLDGFTFYFMGRGGVLGDCEPGVVRSAFGYFHPDVVAKFWNRGREIIDPRQAAREFLACSSRIADDELSHIEGLAVFNDAVKIWRANVDTAGLALYAAVDAEPMDPALSLAAEAYHHVLVLRELRGSAHLLALVASGLSDSKAHAIRRPQDVEAFGWTEPIAVSDSDHEAWERADALTDELLASSIASLSPTQGEALVAGALAIQAAFQDSNRFAKRDRRN